MKTSLVLFFLSIGLYNDSIAQSIYIGGNLSPYSYHYQYKGYYPFTPDKYTAFSPSTNWGLTIGINFIGNSVLEVGFSKIAYRFHEPEFLNGAGLTSSMYGCTYCFAGPGFDYFQDDSQSSTNLNFRYKFNVLPQISLTKNFRLLAMAGATAQFNPSKEERIYANALRLYNQGASDEIIQTYNRTDKTLLLLQVGIEVERRLYKQLFIYGGFTQFIGFDHQMTSTFTTTVNGLAQKGYRYADGTGRSVSLGLRYNFKADNLVVKFFDSQSAGKSNFYFGIDWGSFPNAQQHSNGVTPYSRKEYHRTLFGPSSAKESDNVAWGFTGGYQWKGNSVETGLHLVPSNIGYTLKYQGGDSLHYSSVSYFNVPIRYKRSMISIGRQKNIFELQGTVGLNTSFYAPRFRSVTNTYYAPLETVKRRSVLFSAEVGAEVGWNFRRLRVFGFGRYLLAFQKSSTISFVISNNPTIPGSASTKTSGIWTGFGVGYQFALKNKLLEKLEASKK